MSWKVDDKLIASTLRTMWRRSEQRDAALARTKVRGVGRGHLCEWCNVLVIKPDVDHIVALGPTPNSPYATPDTTWDRWLERLLVEPSGLRVLCKPCHKIKTREDTHARIHGAP